MTTSMRTTMPKWIGVVLSVLFAACALAEDPVHFTDANLKAAVEQALGKTDPTPTDMLALTSLHAPSEGIAGLTGLEYAANLQSLNLPLNQISDISALSGLTSLRWLDLGWNQISDISPLSGLMSLQELYLDSSRISDISPLSSLTSLRELWLYDCQISDISALSGLTNLQWLDLGNNQISDSSALSGLTSLQHLNLWSNQISDISPLSGLTNLQWLDLGNNQISDVSVFSGLTSLQLLSLESNRISDISTLSGLTSLQVLGLRHNQISDISVLSGLTNLTSLWLQANPLNSEAYSTYIPQIQSYGTTVYFDPPALRTLVIVSSVGGSVTTPGEGTYSYDYATVINLVATPDAHYHFVNWTGTAVDAGKVTNSTFASTTVIVDADYTLVANFAIDQRTLTVSASAGGQVSQPGEGTFTYDHGEIVTLEARAGAGYHFVEWSGSFASAANPATLEMNSNHQVTANFAINQHTLTVASGGNGSVTGSGTYNWGSTVSIAATADAHYRFVSWITSGSVTVANASSAGTTVTINGDGTVTANFVIGQHTLTVAVTKYGSVIMPGEGEFEIDAGTILPIEAVSADPNHEFSRWSGTAVERGRVQDPNAATTTVLVDGNYALEAVFVEQTEGLVLGFSLGAIGADDRSQIEYRVADNNTPQATFVERVTGITPDPNGMVRMQTIEGQSARAKGRFGKCYAERVLVQFQYLFESADSSEIVVYLSDVPELLGQGDSLRAEHYVEIGRVPAPPAGCPGSFGSGRFGTFEEWAWASGLDFSHGTWVELELVETEAQVGVAALAHGGIRLASGSGRGSAFFDKLAVQIHCPSGICMNVTWDTQVDWQDLLLIMASCGGTTELPRASCLDGAFSADGYVDSFDACSWDWVLEDLSRAECGNLCRVPLSDGGSVAASGISSLATTSAKSLRAAAVNSWPAGLLVLGKPCWTTTNPPDPRPYKFYLFSDEPNYAADYDVAGLPTCCDVRVVRGPNGQVYLLNSERGVFQLSDDSATQILSPGKANCVSDPRYHRSATISIGIQGQGAASFGRPIFDVAFDAQGYAYVVPVVVQPAGQEAYVAAAKLELEGGKSPSWQLVQLYDDLPLVNDNRRRDCVREIELDDAGNVYVLNVHWLNGSCILWKYSPDGTMQKRVFLLDANSPAKVDDPVALHVSHDGRAVYLACGQYNKLDPDNAVIHGLSTESFSLVRSVTVKSMQLVSSITEDPATGELWVVGFSKADIPASANPAGETFYVPRMARIPPGVSTVQAIDTSNRGTHDLVLPTSVVWTGAIE